MDFARKSDALGLMIFTSVEIIFPFGDVSQAFWWFHLPNLVALTVLPIKLLF
jgi:hypothetical protein